LGTTLGARALTGIGIAAPRAPTVLARLSVLVKSRVFQAICRNSRLTPAPVVQAGSVLMS
jgi:hypothetical protein